MSTPTSHRLRAGVVGVGRSTFDLDRAEQLVSDAVDVVDHALAERRGVAAVVTDPLDVPDEVARWGDIDVAVVLQATFTDARFIQAVADATDAPILLWSFPEARTGGRLALNSLCGMILASFELGQRGRTARWLFLDPAAHDASERLMEVLSAAPPARPATAAATDVNAIEPTLRADAEQIVERLARSRVGIVGQPPEGFGPCGRHPEAERLASVAVESLDLDHVLERVQRVSDEQVAISRARVAEELSELDRMEPTATASSLRLHQALDQLRRERRWDTMALRCWPETFDRLGCSACTPLALLNEDGTAAACEADMLGAITMMILGWLGDSRPALVDLVDVDCDDDTAVVWHCGVAPAEYAPADSPATAGVHPNRLVPLVQQLVMKPGRVTVARLSQSRGDVRFVVAGANALDRPMPYLGSSGVLRFDRRAAEVLETVVNEGLEHHLAVVYGDCVAELEAVAAVLGIPTVLLA